MTALALVSRERGDKTHVHRWTLTMHMDGCHWYRSAYRCVDCTATFITHDERDVEADPWSAMWMSEGEDDCARCDELMAGATPVSVSEYTP